MNWKELIEFLMTNKVIKAAVVICVVVACLVFIFFASLLSYKAYNGEHLKVFGFEINDVAKLNAIKKPINKDTSKSQTSLSPKSTDPVIDKKYLLHSSKF